METKEQKIDSQIKFYKELYKRDLTEEEIEYIKKQFENPVVENIELRDAEVDIRKLSDEDMRQLFYREICDLNQRMIFLGQIMNDAVLASYAIIKLLGGDYVKEIGEIVDKTMEKMNGTNNIN